MVQDSTGTNASISVSRSTTRRTATDCTRPAESPGAHLAPQQRREPVADQAVDDAACLLCGDQRAVDLAGMRERRVDGELGDLVEDDAVGVARPSASARCHAIASPSRSGSAASRVEVAFLTAAREIADLLLLALDQLVLGHEPALDVDADLRLGQIADVPHRREDDVLGPEETGERSRLARRLDDDQT